MLSHLNECTISVKICVIMILVQFYEPKIDLLCASKASFRYISYFPYPWYATFTNGQNGNIVRIIDNFSVKF